MVWDDLGEIRERLMNTRYMIVNMQLGTVVMDHETGEMKTFDSKGHAEKYIEHRNLNTDVYKVKTVK